MVNGKNKLTQSTYVEFQLSIWGAMLLAFGLGVWLNKYFQSYFPLIIIVGVVTHSIGMYRIHKRNQ